MNTLNMFGYFSAFIIVYLLGYLVVFLLQLDNESSFNNNVRIVFYRFFFGTILVIFFTSFYCTKFNSSFITILLPLISLPLIYKYKFKKIFSANGFNTYREMLFVGFLISSYILSNLLFRYYGQIGNQFIFPEVDLINYGDLSNYIYLTGNENVFQNTLTNNKIFMPYHYGDIYFNIYIAKLTSVSVFLSYKTILTTFMIVLIFMGLFTLIFNKVDNILMTLIIVFVSVLFTNFIVGEIFPSNVSLLYRISLKNFCTFPKLCFPTLFFLGSIILYSDKHEKIAIFILNISSILFTNIIIGVLIFDLIYCLNKIYRREDIIKDAIVYLAMYTFYYIYVYTYNGYEFEYATYNSSIYSKLSFFREHTIYWVGGIAITLIPLTCLFCFTNYKNKVLWISVSFIGLLILSLSTILFIEFDSFQLFSTIIWASYPIILALIISTVAKFNIKVFIILILFCFSVIYNFVNMYKLQGVNFELTSFQKEKLISMLQKSKNHNVCFQRNENEYNKNYRILSSYYLRIGLWISAVNSNYIFTCLSDLEGLNFYNSNNKDKKTDLINKTIYNIKYNSFVNYVLSNNQTKKDMNEVKKDLIYNEKIDLILIEEGANKLFLNNFKILDSCTNSAQTETLYLLENN